MKKVIKIGLILAVFGIFFSIPIIPVKVVPEVTLQVVNQEGKLMQNVVILQYWHHWSYESEDSLDEAVSDNQGVVVFSEKK